MSVSVYDKRFYDYNAETALPSARIVAPVVMDLIYPKSVVDVGCGIGAWLAAFVELGVDGFLGIDGEYVDRRSLLIPADRFLAHDLRKPLNLGKRFDLVLSLEVAEHLPASCARDFVGSLTSLGPAVLFSAAIPFQGGEHHVNEQWPEYWARLFAEFEFAPLDFIRRRIWWDHGVCRWYAQNLMLYAHRDTIQLSKRLIELAERTDPASLTMVHPAYYLDRIGRVQRVCEWIRGHTPRPVRAALRSLIRLDKG